MSDEKGPLAPQGTPVCEARKTAEDRHEGGEEGGIPIYLKLAYIIIGIWSVIYFLLYFR